MIAGKKNIESINIYLIGNNPIELSDVYNKLKAIRNKTYRTEIGFELRNIYKKIMRFNPACIIIDDNVEKPYLKKLLQRLAKSKKTKNIPITILKNTNRDSHITQAGEFVLKESVTGELLSRSINNSIKLNKMQQNLNLLYNKRKSQLQGWFARP